MVASHIRDLSSGYEPNAFSLGEPCLIFVLLSDKRRARVSRAGAIKSGPPPYLSRPLPPLSSWPTRELSGEMSPLPRDARVRAGGDGGAILRAPPPPRGIIRVLSPRARRSIFVVVAVLLVVVVLSMAHHAHGSGI